ncbi:hypothetical protein SDC9_115133 [bioreactor metagenome]|uniref:Uncharacterized protein n=1 Tax=bioreactor metagenome TaxID=1076179 RepID=A0A645BSI6_9ZZZZ
MLFQSRINVEQYLCQFQTLRQKILEVPVRSRNIDYEGNQVKMRLCQLVQNSYKIIVDLVKIVQYAKCKVQTVMCILHDTNRRSTRMQQGKRRRVILRLKNF